MTLAQANLTIAAGQLDDDEAIRPADAVIEGVGSESAVTRRIIAAMDAAGVKRFVVVSTCSVPAPADRPDLTFKALVQLVRTAESRAWAEVRSAAEAVRASDGHGMVDLSISRADMAAFLLSQVTDETYLRNALAMTKPVPDTGI